MTQVLFYYLNQAWMYEVWLKLKTLNYWGSIQHVILRRIGFIKYLNREHETEKGGGGEQIIAEIPKLNESYSLIYFKSISNLRPNMQT